MHSMIRILGGTAALVALSASAPAQETSELAQNKERRIHVERDVVVTNPGSAEDVLFTRSSGPPGEGPHAAFEYVASEMGMPGKVVKNAPYSAEAVTERSQVLADGNRISHKSTAVLARDGEGRTRRETSLGVIGPIAGRGDGHIIVFIHDPVAGVSYTLDPQSKTARKMAGKGMAIHIEGSLAGGAHTAGMRWEAPAIMATPGVQMTVARISKDGAPTAKQEDLGKRVIEGVQAEGTRSTLIIPAGEIGNERPIEIVTERWYTPELQTVVMSKHNDPRMGETVYKLSSLRKGEPARSLFEVPSDYAVSEGYAVSDDKMPIMRKLRQQE